MGSEWVSAKLGDYVDSCLGKMLDKNKNKGKLHPYLGNSNVRWGTFELDDLAEMRFEESEHVRYGIKKGDLIVCEGGEPGRCAIWEDEILDMKIQKALHRVRTLEGLDSEYLYYWFLFSGKAGYLEPFFTGTTIKHLTGKALKELPIEIPSLEYQRAGATFLRKFDQKIALNRQINQTLEQMAQALFKSWFVDFDPVIDNALAAGNPIPDELQPRAEQRKALRLKADGEDGYKPLPESVRALFPDAFEESELGWVPEGWEAGTLGSIAKYGSDRTSAESLNLSNYISTENMLQNKQGVCEAAKLPTVKTVPQYSEGHILVSNIRPYFKKIWLARGQGGYSNDVLGFVGKNEGTKEFLFNLLYQDVFFDYMMATSKGCKMPRGDKKAVMDWPVIIPSFELQAFFSESVQEFYQSSYLRHVENETLTNLRDTLLPKLISGELQLDQLPDVVASVA